MSQPGIRHPANRGHRTFPIPCSGYLVAVLLLALAIPAIILRRRSMAKYSLAISPELGRSKKAKILVLSPSASDWLSVSFTCY